MSMQTEYIILFLKKNKVKTFHYLVTFMMTEERRL